MAMSDYYRELRHLVGPRLLMMPAVAAVVHDDEGRILLQQRHDDSWSLPAGAVEPGETPRAAVLREVLEETGLVVQATALLGVVGGAACRVRYPNHDEVEYVVTVFQCKVVSGTLAAMTDETKQLQYFTVEEMPKLAFEYPRQFFAVLAPVLTSHESSLG
jgi:8-oxo-dGTP pyrophosphatase MutT (NUDIX family)